MTIDALKQFVEYAEAPKTAKPPRVILKVAGGVLCAVQDPGFSLKKLGYWWDLYRHKDDYKLKKIVECIESASFVENDREIVNRVVSVFLEKTDEKHEAHQLLVKIQKKFQAVIQTSASSIASTINVAPTLGSETHSSEAEVNVDNTVASMRNLQSLSEQSAVTPQGDTLEQEFWETMYGNKKCRRFLQMVVINSNGSDAVKSELIVEFYSNHKKERDDKFSLTSGEKSTIQKLLAMQMAASRKLVKNAPPKAGRELKLSEGEALKVYRTKGDGSCGLHALLGTNENGEYRCDAGKARQQLCTWVKACYEKDKLPDAIESVLVDYFLHARDTRSDVPSSFRDARSVRDYLHAHFDRYQALCREYNVLPVDRSQNEVNPEPQAPEVIEQKAKINAERDKIKENFTKDKGVVTAYLATLGNVSQYLLQDELAVAGECFGKKIVLHQPGWGEDFGQMSQEVISSGNNGEVHIFYNGANHFERAEVIPP